ncbi:MAG: hypothetical protein ABIT70_05870, partial [Sulfuriferula sp.]
TDAICDIFQAGFIWQMTEYPKSRGKISRLISLTGCMSRHIAPAFVCAAMSRDPQPFRDARRRMDEALKSSDGKA